MLTQTSHSSFFVCPESNRPVLRRLLGVAIVSSLILIANPGFYSHLHLENKDFPYQFGLAISKGQEPSFFSSLMQGLLAFFANQYPFWVHLASALTYGLIAYLFFTAIVRVLGSRPLAWASALVFLVCPLATFSNGWGGVFYEQLAILFGLLAFNSAHDFIYGNKGRSALFVTFLAFLAGTFSLQTAIVLPVILLIISYFISTEKIGKKRLWAVAAAWLITVLYCFVSHILAQRVGGAPVAAGLRAGMIEGLFVSFLYPFLTPLTEAHTWRIHSSAGIGFSIVLHALLPLLIWRAFSLKVALGYLLAFAALTLPALYITDIGAHSLIGAGMPFSLALGALLSMNQVEKGKTAIRIAVRVMLAVGFLHVLVIQHYFYKTGSCMNSIASSTRSAYLASGKPEKMSILVNADAPGYILKRFVHDKAHIAPGSPVQFQVADWHQRNEIETGHVFDCYCQVYSHPDFRLNITNWGPTPVTANTIPNPQADGTTGMWFVTNAGDLGEMVVLMDGQPAKETSVQPEIITATFSPEMIAKSGEKEIAIRQISTGKTFVVGTLVIEPGK
jgi:hypothetical protein